MENLIFVQLLIQMNASSEALSFITVPTNKKTYAYTFRRIFMSGNNELRFYKNIGLNCMKQIIPFICKGQ